MQKTLLSIAVAALFAAATPALSQGNVCAKRENIVEQLEQKHGEVRQSVGLQRNSGVVETFANTETGSWTIIVSMPSGLSCLVAAGEAFQKEINKKVSLRDRGA